MGLKRSASFFFSSCRMLPPFSLDCLLIRHPSDANCLLGDLSDKPCTSFIEIIVINHIKVEGTLCPSVSFFVRLLMSSPVHLVGEGAGHSLCCVTRLAISTLGRRSVMIHNNHFPSGKEIACGNVFLQIKNPHDG